MKVSTTLIKEEEIKQTLNCKTHTCSRLTKEKRYPETVIVYFYFVFHFTYLLDIIAMPCYDIDYIME